MQTWIRRVGAPLALALLAAVPSQAAATAGSATPPVIDRELFFGDPEISGARLSPDGRYLAFLKPYEGTRNIWVKRTEEPFERAKPITADTRRPIPAFLWSRDSKVILFVQDQGGDENYNVYAVDPSAPAAEGASVPKARNLTDAKGVRAFLYAVPESDPDVFYVGLNDRDPAWHDLYKVKISTGERTLLHKNTERITGWFFDVKDQLRLATRSAENGDTEVLRLEGEAFAKIYECDVLESCGPVRFHKDGRRVYLETNKGAGVDLSRLVLFDVQTSKEEPVEADPLSRVDFGAAVFSEVSDDLIATSYQDERERIYWKDKSFEADYNLISKKFPGRDMAFRSSTADERLWIVSTTSDMEPGEAYLFDRKTKALTLQYRVFEKLPRQHLAAMKAIRYKSSDGLEIPAFLTLPKGVPAKNLPLMIQPHGGPWARDTWGYDAFAQFLANRGYAVLQPNFRGSTGYGKKFLDAGNNQWGEKMQDDLTWGVKHLVTQGIADPKRVGIMGGSYGGYATLAGVAFTPDLYAAGVSIVGPSNLITLLESVPPYWEQIVKLFHVRMGDPGTPEGRARLERQSPLNSAAKIKTPLLVIQGANDPRVKKAESDQIVVALRERGFPVEYIVAPDEGHGFARPVNNMAAFYSAEKFLAQHLGGRYQDSMKSEVADRLKEIAVDVKTVEMPKRIDMATVGVPKVTSDLEPGLLSYTAKIEMGTQSMTMPISVDIKEEGGDWVAVETAKTPMGEAVDRAVIAKGSLILRKRTVSQGPVNIDVDFKDGKASGAMTMSGQSRPVAVELPGDLFADGAGANAVLSRLPFADGYRASFRNFDLQTQKVSVKQLAVTGSDNVTVPAGAFETWKVEITSPEDGGKTTLWIAKGTRRPVKVVATSPRMGGATITAELDK